MDVIHIEKTIAKDGEVLITGLPFKKGETVSIAVSHPSTIDIPAGCLTVGEFRASGLIGMWKDRTDLGDSRDFARQLREQAQDRSDCHHNPN